MAKITDKIEVLIQPVIEDMSYAPAYDPMCFKVLDSNAR
jgi:hypothetical protein